MSLSVVDKTDYYIAPFLIENRIRMFKDILKMSSSFTYSYINLYKDGLLDQMMFVMQNTLTPLLGFNLSSIDYDNGNQMVASGNGVRRTVCNALVREIFDEFFFGDKHFKHLKPSVTNPQRCYFLGRLLAYMIIYFKTKFPYGFPIGMIIKIVERISNSGEYKFTLIELQSLLQKNDKTLYDMIMKHKDNLDELGLGQNLQDVVFEHLDIDNSEMYKCIATGFISAIPKYFIEVFSMKTINVASFDNFVSDVFDFRFSLKLFIDSFCYMGPEKYLSIIRNTFKKITTIQFKTFIKNVTGIAEYNNYPKIIIDVRENLTNDITYNIITCNTTIYIYQPNHIVEILQYLMNNSDEHIRDEPSISINSRIIVSDNDDDDEWITEDDSSINDSNNNSDFDSLNVNSLDDDLVSFNVDIDNENDSENKKLTESDDDFNGMDDLGDD